MKFLIIILYFMCSFFAFGAGVDSIKKTRPYIGLIGWITLTFAMHRASGEVYILDGLTAVQLIQVKEFIESFA